MWVMAEPGFPDISRRLDRVAAWVRPPTDNLMVYLSALGRSGAGVGIGMIVDGALVFGAIGPESLFRDAVSDAAQDAFEGMGLDQNRRQAYTDAWNQMLEAQEKHQSDRDELMERYDKDVDIDDVALEDVYALSRLRVPDPVVDLHDVLLHVEGRDPLAISSMRVNLSRISAWWPLKAQGVNVVYNSAAEA